MVYKSNERKYVNDGRILNNKIKLKKVSEEFLKILEDEFKDYLLYIEGETSYEYDNSDDERASSYSSSTKFGYYRDLDIINNSEHLIVVNDKVIGVVFYISEGYNSYRYYEFLFDGSYKKSFSVGYSASHSSHFVYVEKVSLVKKGENGVPTTANKMTFKISSTATSI